MAKKLVIINAPPFGGKSHLKRILLNHNVACIDMSELIVARENIDPSFAELSKKLKEQGELIPCEIILEIFSEHITASTHNKYVLCGIPRTPIQAHAIAHHPFFQHFQETRIVDVSVSEDLLRRRFETRKKKEDRVDDTLENFQIRINKFHQNRMSILHSFNSHPRWGVSCISGDSHNATDIFAENLIKSMRLSLREHSSTV